MLIQWECKKNWSIIEPRKVFTFLCFVLRTYCIEMRIKRYYNVWAHFFTNNNNSYYSNNRLCKIATQQKWRQFWRAYLRSSDLNGLRAFFGLKLCNLNFFLWILLFYFPVGLALFAYFSQTPAIKQRSSIGHRTF